MRGIGPMRHEGMGAIFLYVNRNACKAQSTMSRVYCWALQTKPLAQFAWLLNVEGVQSALAPEDLTIGPQRCTSALLMSSMTSGLVPMML